MARIIKSGNVFSKPVKTGDSFLINGESFKVIGILQSVGNPGDDKNIYMPEDDFKSLFNSGNRVDEIIVQVQPGQILKDVADRTEVKLRKY